ncbi:MAG: hypothetical protein AAFX06_02935 [Planctomycetota bacterium]
MIRKRYRTGYTLREVSIALALGSTVFIAATGLVHSAFNWSSMGRNHRQDDQTFFRLRNDFCSDTHLATDVEVTENEVKLTTSDGSEIVYRIEANRVKRSQTQDETIVRREAYRWKSGRVVALKLLDSENQIELAVSSITPHAGKTPLWRVAKASIGLRLLHERGEIEP